MRFQEILEASSPDHADEELVQFFHRMYQECQPFLKAIGGDPTKYIAYRGMEDRTMVGRGLEDDYGIKSVRLEDRHPKDTPEEGHNALNQYFELKHGHPFRNGLFVTGSIMTADAYGEPYAIFPIGKFEYLWNPNIDDLTTEVYDYVDTELAQHHNTMHEHTAWVEYFNSVNRLDHMVVPVTPEQMSKFLKTHTTVDLIEFVIGRIGLYQDHKLQEALGEEVEIMIWCQEYYYILPSLLEHFKNFISK